MANPSHKQDILKLFIMTGDFLIIFLLGAAAGGFINGLAGFGTALFSLSLWLLIMPPTQAVSITLLISVLTGLQGAWLVRRQIAEHKKRLATFICPGLLGIPFGIFSLSYLDITSLKIIVAGFMLAYGGFFTIRGSLPLLSAQLKRFDVLVGFIGGVLGGVAGLSGALPTMWLSMRPWSKHEIRAVLQPYNLAILGVSIIGFAYSGYYDRQTLTYFLFAIPVSLVSAQLGIKLFTRLSTDQFRRRLITLMLISGLALLFHNLFLN